MGTDAQLSFATMETFTLFMILHDMKDVNGITEEKRVKMCCTF